MRSTALVLLLLCACAHDRAADPNKVPAPWPAPTAPPPARSPASPTPNPTPATPPAALPAEPRAAKDAEIPDEGAARPIVVPRPDRARLACGAELLVVRRPRLPLATFYVLWPIGAADEPLDRAGLANLTADLMTEGAGKRGALEVAAEAQRLGARLTSSAGWDSSGVSMTTLTHSLDPALSLLSDVLLHPRFEDKEVERLRKTATTSLLQLTDQPNLQAALVGSRALYGHEHRYAELMQGSKTGLASITREQIVAWHKAQLAIGRATVIAVGDVESKSLKAKLDRLLGPKKPLPPATEAARAQPPEPRARVLLVDKPGAAQTELRAYQIGPPRSTPDYFPLLVFNTILGGNFTSRLNSKLREQKGYTYGARSDFAFRRAGGPFNAGAPVKTAVTADALSDLRAELRRIVDSEISEGELSAAKQTLERALARQFETPPEVASALGSLRVYGLPEDYFASYAGKVEAVTIAEVRRVAAMIKPDAMSLVFVGDEKVIGESVKKALGAYEKVELKK